jgi:hypothetical protein
MATTSRARPRSPVDEPPYSPPLGLNEGVPPRDHQSAAFPALEALFAAAMEEGWLKQPLGAAMLRGMGQSVADGKISEQQCLAFATSKLNAIRTGERTPLSALSPVAARREQQADILVPSATAPRAAEAAPSEPDPEPEPEPEPEREPEPEPELEPEPAQLKAQIAQLKLDLQASRTQAETDRRAAATMRTLYTQATAGHAVSSQSSASELRELQVVNERCRREGASEMAALRQSHTEALAAAEQRSQQVAEESEAVSHAAKRFLDQQHTEALGHARAEHSAAMDHAGQAAAARQQEVERSHEQAVRELTSQHTAVIAAASAAAAAQAVQTRETFAAELAEVAAGKESAIAEAASANEALRQLHADTVRAAEANHEVVLQRTASSHSEAMVVATKEFASQIGRQQTIHVELVSEHKAASAAAKSEAQRVEELQAELRVAAEAMAAAEEAHETRWEEAESKHAQAIEEEMEAGAMAAAEELISSQSDHEATVDELTAEHNAAVEAAGAEVTEMRAELDALRQSSAEALETLQRNHELDLTRANYAHSLAMEAVTKACAEQQQQLESRYDTVCAELTEVQLGGVVPKDAELAANLRARNVLLEAEVESLRQGQAQAIATARESQALADCYSAVVNESDRLNRTELEVAVAAAKSEAQRVEELQAELRAAAEAMAAAEKAHETRWEEAESRHAQAIDEEMEVKQEEEQEEDEEVKGVKAGETAIDFVHPGSLGLNLTPCDEGKRVMVLAVQPNGQGSSHAELRPGMVITDVGGVSTHGKTYEEVTALIGGQSERPLRIIFGQL